MTRRRSGISDTGMSLTPMIDIMTTLLAVFMVTTPLMTAGIDIDLPRAGKSTMTGNDHAIQISVDAKGNYYLLDMQLPRDEIVKRAIAMRGENPNLAITLSGDTHADYGAVMSMMGKLKDVGFQRVGLRTQIDNK
ncbi:MAG: biopolymer transporter ExbD [Alphaproteobacteria bacterium]|nr:biopolymer transporter ExbD [Alphaproteobacteria bacterium]